MRLKSLILASLAASAAMTASPALAQQEPQTIQGSIQICPAARGEHRIQLEQGRRYTITARSDSFDTVLRLFRNATDTTPLAENDDDPEGGGLNSRITFQAPETGEYIARVSSYSQAGTGDYQLRVEPAAPLPPLVTSAGRTERGQWRLYQGELTANDPRDAGRHFDDYELRLPAGRAAMIHLSSSNVDTFLKVYSLEGRGALPVAQDDDSGGGTDSFIFFAPEQPGTYVVRVTTFGEDSTGAYRLRISDQPAPTSSYAGEE